MYREPFQPFEGKACFLCGSLLHDDWAVFHGNLDEPLCLRCAGGYDSSQGLARAILLKRADNAIDAISGILAEYESDPMLGGDSGEGV